MEDLEESKSYGSMDSNERPPKPPLMKSRRNMFEQSSREYRQSSVSPSPASSFVEENLKKASCMISASLENRDDTSSIPPEYTSSTIPISTPPLTIWTRNTILSASISNRQPAFKTTFRTATKSEVDDATSSALAKVEDVKNWTSAFSPCGKRALPESPSPQFEMDALTPSKGSNTEVSAGKTRETLEQPDACELPVGSRRPIPQYTDSSKAMAQNQDPDRRSKCKTLQRCQVCQKEFQYVSRLRYHERVHTGDRPFKCDVCGKSFTRSEHLCVHKRTHTGDRPFKCDVCGKSFTRSDNLCVHKRTHTGERPHKCKTCGTSFLRLPDLRRHERIHSG
ncbi:zinc finger protein 184-like [Sycon ciliatum]|uniref:zinc finger protein 184-like n=1 Tax=Sycon ciliatum TaxID=27933 RepID=UPI0031F63909